MFAFILYELKVAVLLAAFYLCFKSFLSKEKLHRVNRIVLISTSVLSFILPLCIITIHKTVPMQEMIENAIVNVDEAQSVTTAVVTNSGISWESMVIAIYLLGVALVLCGIVVGITRVMKTVSSGKKMQMDGCEVIVCEGDVPPFSWMRWIVMARADFESGNRHILEHEKAHIRLGHSRDVLLVDVLSAFQWFNPAIWLLKSELRAVHEYEADDAVLSNGVNIKEYQYSLIRKAVSASGYSITNSFNHSILKNRITMMSKSKASWMRGLRVLYILPLLCGSLALNAKTVINYKNSDNQDYKQESSIKVDVKIEKNKPVYYVEGVKTSLDNISGVVAEIVKTMEFPTTVISCDHGVKMEAVSDLKIELRKAGALKVSYSSTSASGSSDPTRRLAPAQKTGMVIDPDEAVNSIPVRHHYPLKINARDEILFHNAPVALENLYSSLVKVIENDHEAVIVLQNDMKSSYDTYRRVQSDIMLAVAAVRESYAKKTFGKAMADLDENQNAEAFKNVPLSVVEVESDNQNTK